MKRLRDIVRPFIWKRWLSLFLALLLLVPPELGAGWDFNTINERTQRLYGPATPTAQRNIDAWEALLKQPTQGNIQATLNRVNQFFNSRIRFVDDITVWGQEDYWATPVEALRKGAGDCEDYALAKYFTLRELGVPASQLRITYVKALQLNQAHMVVTWYSTPDAIPLVLDNLKPAILPATARSDLLFIPLTGKVYGSRRPAAASALATVNDFHVGRIFSPGCVQKGL